MVPAMRILVRSVLAAGIAATLSAQATSLHEALDASDPRWHGAVPIAEGITGGAARFDGARARIDVGPCPVSSREPFTLRCALRTTRGDFCTPLMARAGDAVGLSLVIGRRPGLVAFEAWSWRSVSLSSRVRIDDGRWHRIEATYDPAANLALLFVDGELQAAAELGEGASPEAVLRLGDNIGAHQPFAGDLDEVELTRAAAPREHFALLQPVVPPADRAAALRALRERLLPRSSPALAGATGDRARSRQRTRGWVQDCLGLLPPPPRRPLDVQVHGELVRDGVRLQRLSWVGFPGERATGWLWTPASPPPGPRPAVLCPHGHWQDGARHPVVQARCASFAKFGWTALAVDSVHVEHVASGVNAIGAMTWHNQRALDLLLARPDVDPARIACTGASGGGQQTYYLMAVEDRLAAAAPIVMACYFAEIVDDTSAHCGCNHPPRLAAATDVPQMCAVFAPKPALFGSVTGDWTRNFPREGLPELRAHWAALHGPEVRSRHADEGHNYDRPMREAVYGFLHDALEGPAAGGAPRATVPEPEFAPFPAAELAPLLRARPNARLDPSAAAREHLARRPRVPAWRDLAPGLRFDLPAREVDWRAGATGGWLAGTVRGDDSVPVPLRACGAAARDDLPYTVIVDPRGSAAVLAERPAWLAAVGRPVLVDPRPYGEWSTCRAAWQRNGLLLGRGEGYQAALDTALVCAALPGAAPVHLVGLGEAGVVALLAAHLCDRIERLVTDDLGPPFAADGNRQPLCPELLRWGDLPESIAALPAGCGYALGGACSAASGSGDRTLGPPFSAAELAERLRQHSR
ncbi:MAG: hypothetical protein FJ265_05105 [Planctomycetes bacterium]|nr:hypothetical protein [Planctomycetota bacterium]